MNDEDYKKLVSATQDAFVEYLDALRLPRVARKTFNDLSILGGLFAGLQAHTLKRFNELKEKLETASKEQ